MTTNSTRREQIVRSLRDKEDRDIFVSEEIDTGLPFQIRALRKDRGWSQRELAERVGITQEGISRLESLSYGRYTLTTLKRLASAFDVALVVRFEPFSRLIEWTANLSPEDLAVPDYEHDPGLRSRADRREPTQTMNLMPPMRQMSFDEMPYKVRYLLPRLDTPKVPAITDPTPTSGRTTFYKPVATRKEA